MGLLRRGVMLRTTKSNTALTLTEFLCFRMQTLEIQPLSKGDL